MNNTFTPRAQPVRSSKRKWPDMSFYGIHFGIVEMPNGEPRLVMVDEEGSWAPLAKTMGFSQSRWFGLYVKSSTKLDIPGFYSNFPSAKVLDLSDEEIRARIRPLIRARKDQRLSQMNSGRGRLSWHPTRTDVATAVTTAVSEPVAEESVSLSPEQALRQTLLLGMNYMGQDVYESGDGQRFVRSGGVIVAKESSDAAQSAVFLRVRTDDDLVQVAAGMIREIDADRRLRSDDFIRFMEASQGPDSHEDKEAVGRFHVALDRATRDRIASIDGAGRDVFDEALRIHEGRPTFWRAPGSLPTPLPISVVMQALASAKANSAVDAVVAPVIIDITSNPGAHSWSLPATSVSGADIPEHDISLAGVFGQLSLGQSISGIRVTRTDTEMLMSALAKRRAEGLTVFLVTAEKTGKLDSEFRRVLSAVGQKYEISGLTDIDAAMVGPGNEQCSRLIVIGNKRQAQDYTFAVPAEIPVIYDYISLWNWGEALRAASFGEIQSFGDDGREENRWQAPYIPASQISEPVAMSPRNLLGPVRKALSNIVEKSGLGVDEFVCSKMGWTMVELETRLDAEQADAVALGIQAIDDGMGMIEADATGLGKGRVDATLAVYGRRKGMSVMFMTEKADLFSDFYRDVNDIGCASELDKPFIVNNDFIVRDIDTNVEIARSPKRAAASMYLACGEIPPECNLVLATYSQFNRKYDNLATVKNTEISRVIKSIANGILEPFQGLIACREYIDLPDYGKLNIFTSADALVYEENEAVLLRNAGVDLLVAQCEARIALLSLGKDDLLKNLSSLVKTDMTTLKHQWLYSGVMNGGLVILDESHVAAGDTSQTGVNLQQLVDNAGSMTYSSATFAKDIKNFNLYSRLFPSTLRAANIGETLERGGEPMQEILCAMLAEDGRLVRREHDLSNLEFKVSSDTLRLERNENWANAFAQVLASMSFLSGEVEEVTTKLNKEVDTALKMAVAGIADETKGMPKVGFQYTNFSSKFYNLSRVFTMAVNADLAADLAIKALKEGRKPVITIENTMEAVLRELVEGVTLDDVITHTETSAEDFAEMAKAAIDQNNAVLASFDPLGDFGDDSPAAPLAGNDPLANVVDDVTTSAQNKTRIKKPDVVSLGRKVGFRDIFLAYIDSMFTATKQTRKGNKVVSSTRISVMTSEMRGLVDEIHKFINAMPDIPLSPIDLVRDRIVAAGFTVDEITGRTMSLQEQPDGTHSIVRMGSRDKQALIKTFNAGQLDALVLSLSGATGISLHASRKFADQSQRELIELQPAADIARRLQFWGRVNRKGQACHPIINMVNSSLPAEMRLKTMQNSKLRKLSANISGNADNSAVDESAPDILNRIGNEVSFRWMEANPKTSSILGYKIGEIPDEQARFSGTKFVDMLTGRLAMLAVSEQRRVYSEITTEFKALIEQYELEGRNPLKSAEFDLRARKTATTVLQGLGNVDSVFNGAVMATELSYDIKVDALDRAIIEAEAVGGHAALVLDYGTEYVHKIVNSCLLALDSALPDMLPKRFATIEQALAEQTPNCIRNAKHKFDWLTNFIPRVLPGSIIAFSNEGNFNSKSKSVEADSFMDYFYVTGWKVPTSNFLSLAGYKLQGYSARTRKRLELSMSSIMTRPSCWIESESNLNLTEKEKAVRDKKDSELEGYHKELSRTHAMNTYFRRVALPASGTEKRIVLDGNLYGAAELANAQKQGSAITYTDEKGVWHHSILMPKSYSMNNIADLPVPIDSTETLVAAFASSNDLDKMLIVTDRLGAPKISGNENGCTYRVYGNLNNITVSSYGSADLTRWMHGSDAIKVCLQNGDFKGSRNQRIGEVISGMEEQFLQAFMKEANQAGAYVMMAGDRREWFNNYIKVRNTGETSQNVVDVALSTKDDDEFSSLLATPSI